MKFTLPEDVFPELVLSKEEERAVQEAGERLKQETIAAFDDFIAHGRTFPKMHYKLVKTKDQLAAFRTRRDHGSSSSSKLARLRTVSSSLGSSNSQGDARDYPDAPPFDFGSRVSRQASYRTIDGGPEYNAKIADAASMVVVTGILPGTVKDFAFSNIADNEPLWKVRNAYVKDDQDDSRILAKMVSPSREDPFRFAGVKWIAKRCSFFSLPHDMLYAEDCGVTQDKRGNITAGYHLVHSVEIARIGELRQFDVRRLRMSLCFITRKHDDSHVEVFCRAFPQPGEERFDATSYAQELLHSCDVMHCSYTKKLMWLSIQKGSQRASDSHRDDEYISSTTHCRMCTKSLKGLGGLMRSICACQCCRRIVCGKCSVDKKIVVDVTSEGVTQRPLSFCVECVTEAKQLCAWEVASASAPSSRTH